ncbi:hypothetical protein BaRGS_00004785 [Batillaria attramentaria]|uniref:Uncharacterized protein n=1 Tax=Batillaria attramentaria TaxID=370345 RepID=A0ABD0LXA3_9CAEN
MPVVHVLPPDFSFSLRTGIAGSIETAGPAMPAETSRKLQSNSQASADEPAELPPILVSYTLLQTSHEHALAQVVLPVGRGGYSLSLFLANFAVVPPLGQISGNQFRQIMFREALEY